MMLNQKAHWQPSHDDLIQIYVRSLSYLVRNGHCLTGVKSIFVFASSRLLLPVNGGL